MNEVLYQVEEVEKTPKKPRKSRLFTVCVFLFLFGVLYGGYIILSQKNETFLKITNEFFKVRTEGGFLVPFASTFITGAVFLFIFFINSFWGTGQALTVLLLVFNGVSYGSVATNLYLAMGWRGVFFFGLTILPSYLLSGTISVISATESIKFSALLLKTAFVKDFSFPQKKTAILFKKNLLFLIAIFISSTVCGVLSKFLSPLFLS